MADDIQRTELTWDAVSDWEVLQRGLITGRVHGEIMLRELAQVRLLEEEVRRELEMEQVLTMRKRHNGLISSSGVTPEASDDMAVWSHFVKEMIIESLGVDMQDLEDPLPGFALPKGSENCVLNRPQGLHILPSQELATGSALIGKDNNLSSQGRQDPGGGGILAFQGPEITAPPAKESFVDMLKSSTKKATPEADAAAAWVLESDVGLGAKSNKKKGKKGRQIDPSLLGFKVHSNRILMGEIQRPNE
ncbi:hypothetical protein Taro_013176 [Colocasia esculenta]|uniref:Uncharacterized protein n=1 Tax=Colocasia esculenta TaxID=4460 RepID=A0A843UAV6_COLES|nr:hypothetical protein [Colocasia esculenta]